VLFYPSSSSFSEMVKKMRFFLTGHTGFKGSWFVPFLKAKGHSVIGFSDTAHPDSLYTSAELSKLLEKEYWGDIRDSRFLTKAINESDPEVIVHFAAQSLVRVSYLRPRETFETNFIGTLNVLENLQGLQHLRSVLIVTTDKVYLDSSKKNGYTETDPLSGSDPYSSSKAAADLLTQSWVKSFNLKSVNVARAGNVIGGGDWNQDRLIPDIVKAIKNQEKPLLRFPNSIRPWQHVLDCLNGYYALIEYGIRTKNSSEWNFGPVVDPEFSVKKVTSLILEEFNSLDAWGIQPGNHPKESQVLLLDSRKAREILQWKEVLSTEQAVKWTSVWYKALHDGANPLKLIQDQILEFNSRLET
jgi:CDP-glucose 4,6-dehydratase